MFDKNAARAYYAKGARTLFSTSHRMTSKNEFFWGAASTCGRRPSNEDAHVV